MNKYYFLLLAIANFKLVVCHTKFAHIIPYSIVTKRDKIINNKSKNKNKNKNYNLKSKEKYKVYQVKIYDKGINKRQLFYVKEIYSYIKNSYEMFIISYPCKINIVCNKESCNKESYKNESCKGKINKRKSYIFQNINKYINNLKKIKKIDNTLLGKYFDNNEKDIVDNIPDKFMNAFKWALEFRLKNFNCKYIRLKKLSEKNNFKLDNLHKYAIGYKENLLAMLQNDKNFFINIIHKLKTKEYFNFDIYSIFKFMNIDIRFLFYPDCHKISAVFFLIFGNLKKAINYFLKNRHTVDFSHFLRYKNTETSSEYNGKISIRQRKKLLKAERKRIREEKRRAYMNAKEVEEVAEDGAKEVEEVAEDGAKEVEEVAEDGAKEVEEVAEDGAKEVEEVAEDGAKEVEEVAEDGAKEVEEVAEDGAKEVEEVAEDGAKEVEEVAEDGAKEVEEVAEDGAKEVEEVAEDGAKEVEEVAEDGAKEVEEVAEDGAKEVEEVAEDGAKEVEEVAEDGAKEVEEVAEDGAKEVEEVAEDGAKEVAEEKENEAKGENDVGDHLEYLLQHYDEIEHFFLNHFKTPDELKTFFEECHEKEDKITKEEINFNQRGEALISKKEIIKNGMNLEMIKKIIMTSPRLSLISNKTVLKRIAHYKRELNYSYDELKEILYDLPQFYAFGNLKKKYNELLYLHETIDENDLKKMIKLYPRIFTYNVYRTIRPKLLYLIRHLNKSFHDTLSFPQYFSYSFRLRIIPRHVAYMNLYYDNYIEYYKELVRKYNYADFNDKFNQLVYKENIPPINLKKLLQTSNKDFMKYYKIPYYDFVKSTQMAKNIHNPFLIV
ncbi:conserved Plasmodium protein, unknown function [Plasmodium ovale]|uniref:mTERF domain-containing protein n=1 Tax=Plasmodium ovale TaxID=36330 RepID=A0A1D3KX01_PLAOA|nr:conserved Plasmodium protein, unknown function [Plasmodium ovale]